MAHNSRWYSCRIQQCLLKCYASMQIFINLKQTLPLLERKKLWIRKCSNWICHPIKNFFVKTVEHLGTFWKSLVDVHQGKQHKTHGFHDESWLRWLGQGDRPSKTTIIMLLPLNPSFTIHQWIQRADTTFHGDSYSEYTLYYRIDHKTESKQI